MLYGNFVILLEILGGCGDVRQFVCTLKLSEPDSM